MISFTISPQVCDALKPRPFVPSIEWAARNVTLPKGSEIRGKFRLDLFPHIREPLECFDDEDVRSISCQFGSRLGKTVLGQVCLAKTADTNPHPMALADADEKSVRRVIRRLWEILEHVPGLEGNVPPRRLQSGDHVELIDCVVHGCWSGSASTAADFAALVVVKNEIDKMSTRKSAEADFAQLMDERAKGFRRAKILNLSTPGVRGDSRIEALRLAGDNRARYVPCPHCNHWQTLRTGDGRTPGGLRWEKAASGRSEPRIALETAWYECAKCRKKILDEHRYALLNAGRWVPEGQTISGSGKISGTPARPGPDASFGPLGTLHSLLPSITWGVVAKKFLESRGNSEARRNYQNSWEGVSWDPQPAKVEPHQLVARLGTDAPMRVCPEWSRFLTAAADVGRAGEDLIFYWMCCAWGLHGRGALVDYGIEFQEDKFRAKMLALEYPHADGRPPLKPARVGVDAGDGFVSNRVYALCAPFPEWWPIKGSAHSNFPDAYRVGFQTAGLPGKVVAAKRKAGLGDLLEPNTQRSQEWVEDLIAGTTKRDAPEWFSLPEEACLDPDFLDQLLADYPDEVRTEAGRVVCNWKRRGANEFRDSLRYCWTLAWHYTRNGRLWVQLPDRQPRPAPPRRATSPGFTTPDGRAFLASNR